MFTVLLMNLNALCSTTQQALLSRWSIYWLIYPLLLTTSLQVAAAQCDTDTQATPIPLSYQVIARHPHRNTVFTQGLVIEEDILYESGGLYGRSSLDKMRLADLAQSQLLAAAEVPTSIFAEGIAIVGEHIIQLTWKAGRAFVYNKADLTLLKEWRYQGEGWGLTYDGQALIMSNGTSQLAWRDTQNFALLKSVAVRINGQPLVRLNELEWIAGYVWANVWHQNFIGVIHPETGTVVATLDLSALTAEGNHARSEVLNGIAYDSQTGHIWVTGKNWETLYELTVDLSVLPAINSEGVMPLAAVLPLSWR